MPVYAQKQILRPPSTSTPELQLEDAENVRNRYPQTNKENRINWALACGSAAKFLLEADDTKERNIKNGYIPDRSHKDLEIYLFGDENLKGKAKNPLDIFGVNFFGPLQTVDYSMKEEPEFSFFVEALKGYYFGFVSPKENDIVQLKLDNKKFYSLSPEFIIASKLFSTKGIREGVDDKDSLNLLRKFDTDNKYLTDLIKTTKYNFIGEDEVNNLEELLKSGDFFKIVTNNIKAQYSKSGLDIEEMPYNCLVSLLDYLPEYFIVSRQSNKKLNEHLNWFIENLYLKYCSEPKTAKTNTMYLIQNFNPDYIDKIIHNMNRGDKDEENLRLLKLITAVIRFKPGNVSEVNKILTRLSDIINMQEIPPEESSNIFFSIAESMIYTPFINVKQAKYSAELDKIILSKNTNEEFYNFIDKLKSDRWIK